MTPIETKLFSTIESKIYDTLVRNHCPAMTILFNRISDRLSQRQSGGLKYAKYDQEFILLAQESILETYGPEG
jgi:hypothetical protein